MDHLIPVRPKTGLTIWNSLWPPLLYMAVQVLIISFFAPFVLVVVGTISGNLPDYSDLGDFILKQQIPLSGFAMAVCLCIFIPFFIKWRSDRGHKSGHLTPLSVFFIFLLTFSSFYVVGILISFFPENFGNYNDLMQYLDTGPLWIKLPVIGIGAAFTEEFCCRGLCQERLSRIMKPTPAIILQALIFGILHMNIIQSSYAFLLGVLLGWLYHKAKTLWAPILFHCFFNSGNILLSELYESLDLNIEAEFEEASAFSQESLTVLLFFLAVSALLIFALNRIFNKQTRPLAIDN